MTASKKRTRVSRQDVIDEFQTALWMTDTGSIDVALATVIGNRMPGAAIWTLMVGAPSSGKTVLLEAILGLPDAYEVDTFSEAALLSASSDGTPGLLREMGDHGILVFPDFTVLLSKSSAERGGAMGVLRRVHDGSLTRRTGNRGGAQEWEGKAGCLGAVTQAVYLADLGIMGERFLYYPLPKSSDTDRVLAGFAVLDHLEVSAAHRARRADVVARFFDRLYLPDQPPKFSEREQERLVHLADLGTKCRSSVPRDRFKGDAIEMIPDPEHLPRLLGGLGQLAVGMRVIGTPEEELWRLVAEVSLGGINPVRRSIIEMLVRDGAEHATAAIAGRVRLSDTSVRRPLQDLAALGVLDRVVGHPEHWVASEWLKERWRVV